MNGMGVVGRGGEGRGGALDMGYAPLETSTGSAPGYHVPAPHRLGNYNITLLMYSSQKAGLQTNRKVYRTQTYRENTQISAIS